ncbi:MAG: GNAT family N-acetyltransferase, partial [Dehalococcoidia bacterium]
MIVTLRDLRADDAAWLDTWLGVCAASVGYDVIDVDAPARSLLVRLEHGDLNANVIVAGEKVGVVTYLVRAPAMIQFIGVQPSQVRRGYGQAGAALVEDVLRAAGVTTIYAAAPAIHGIDVYFWIRLGYRPLLQAEWPCTRDGFA